MKRLTAATRIALCMSILSTSALLLAKAAGLVPDHRSAILQGRIALSEALAINCSALASRGDAKQLDAMLRAVARRTKTNRAEVPGWSCRLRSRIIPSSMPTSASLPVSAPAAAPTAMPARGIRKRRPISPPHRAPPAAPAAVRLTDWCSWTLPSWPLVT